MTHMCTALGSSYAPYPMQHGASAVRLQPVLGLDTRFGCAFVCRP